MKYLILLGFFIGCTTTGEEKYTTGSDNSVKNVTLGSHYEYYADGNLKSVKFYDYIGNKLFGMELSGKGNLIIGIGRPLYVVVSDTVKRGEELELLLFCAMHEDFDYEITINNEPQNLYVGEFGFTCFYSKKIVDLGAHKLHISYNITNRGETLYKYSKTKTIYCL